jgi:hypothetical protein
MDNNSLDETQPNHLEIDIEVKPEKKKRGRKPKIVENKPESKRDGKSKQEKEKDKDEKKIKIPRKRGRKPKIEKIMNEPKEMESVSNIILHLPINFNKKTNNPNAFENTQSFYEIQNNLKKMDKNIESTVNLNDYIKERNEIYNQNNIIFLRYNESNKKNEWPKSTNYDCLWDSYPFSNIPFGIPIKKNKNVVHMFGNFCSPECAAAYCFTMNDNIWEKYSLLNDIYGKNKPIRIANSKLLLKKFGGIYTIDEFRSLNINNSKIYKVCLPPILSLIPTLEETNIDINDTLYFEKNELKKINKFKLQRTKQVNDTNSLENIMNLKYL